MEASSGSYDNPTTEFKSEDHLTTPMTFTSVAILVGRYFTALQKITDWRVQFLMEKLNTERYHMLSWTNGRRIISVSQLESMTDGLPALTKHKILSLCKPLKDWYAASAKETKPTWLRDPKERVNALELLLEGYSILETLRALNAGLESLAASLSSHGSDAPIPLENQQRNVSRPTALRPTESVNEHDDLLTGPVYELPTGPARDEQSSEGSPGCMRFFFLNCIQGLQTVTAHVEAKESSRRLYQRLMVWGCGLFSNAMDLDHILESDKGSSGDAASDFRRHIVGTMGDIAITLEQLLISFGPTADPEVQKSITKLEAGFGAFKEFCDEAMDDDSEPSEPPRSGDHLAFQASCIEKIDGLLDCLFDVLPSIDRLRQIWLLNLERRSNEIAPTVATTTTISGPEVAGRGEARAPTYTSQAEDRGEISIGCSPAVIQKPLYGVSPVSSDRPYSPDLSTVSRYIHSQELTPQYSAASRALPKQQASLTRSYPEPFPSSESRDKGPARGGRDEDSMGDLLNMDFELAVAIRASLVDAKEQAIEEKRRDAEIMKQIQLWDYEIQRLRDWSNAFEKSLQSKASDSDVKKQYLIFEQLAKIGSTFASAVPSRSKEADHDIAANAERRLESAASGISRSSGKSVDIKISRSGKTLTEALETLRQANNDLRRLR